MISARTTGHLLLIVVGVAGLSCRKSAPPPPPPATDPSTSSPATAPDTPVGGDLKALQAQANALTMAGEHERAMAVYQRILEHDPNDRTARFNLAVACQRQRLFTRAEDLYRQLLAGDQDSLHAQARYNLAGLYQAQGKLAQAVQEYQSLVREAPRMWVAHTALGELWLEMGQPAPAMEAFTEAVRINPDVPSSQTGLAQAARAAGSIGRATVAARKATELDPNSSTNWRLLGDISLDLHRASKEDRFLIEATDAWRQSLRLDPNQPDLHRLLDTALLATENSAATRPATRPSPTSAGDPDGL